MEWLFISWDKRLRGRGMGGKAYHSSLHLFQKDTQGTTNSVK
ncbi:MAG: Unknown protein [uncultured Sulfurovum sp.]|uniref:Uncharacterized protein n=1 Tax=uncultured Sulfurovum sp. TaxID=269237 RepID=A0A6S6S6W2_9BACT|nr:MAG: Unknown protein [uncultured Sulfurovum sp.]